MEVKSQEDLEVLTESKPTVSVENVKNSVSIHEREHIITLLRLLIKEDINLKNLSIKKDKLNNLVGTYLQRNEIASNQKETIIEGVLTGLSKIG